MARANGKASGNKRTSFGKRTEAEKSFRTRKHEKPGRSESFEKPKGERSFSGARKSSSSRFDRGEGKSSVERKPRANKPFGDGEKRFAKPGAGKFSSSRFGGEKPREERGSSFGRKSDRPKPFTKREGGSSYGEKKFSKPSDRKFSSSRFDSEKPREERGSSFGRKSGEAKPFRSDRPKPFARKREDDQSTDDSRFAKREGKDFSAPRFGADEDKKKSAKPFEKKEEGTDRFSKFKKEVKPFSSTPDRFAKTERPEDEKRDFKKPFVTKERKTFTSTRPDRTKKNSEAAAESEEKADDLVRLNKFMANSGVGSRREADELIKIGLVTVNGETITEMGHKIKPTDDVRYEGRKLKAEPLVYILLNKPKGFITTTDDPEERKTVMELVASACKERIYPVGRLDRNTTGLLLLTNDGDLADKLTHPSYKAKKIYKVELDRALTKNDFQKIIDGVYLEEGRAEVDDLAIVSEDGKEIGIELHIGWNRIVRRIFEALGYQIVKLDRVAYAGLDKKDIGRGQWRFLKSEEIVLLKHFKP